MNLVLRICHFWKPLDPPRPGDVLAANKYTPVAQANNSAAVASGNTATIRVGHGKITPHFAASGGEQFQCYRLCSLQHREP